MLYSPNNNNSRYEGLSDTASSSSRFEIEPDLIGGGAEEDGRVFAVAVCTGLHKGGMNEELANEAV